MSILFLCQLLAFAHSLSFGDARVPSLNFASLPRRAVAAKSSLQLSSNLILPPLSTGTNFRNISTDAIPPTYVIPNTDPPIILQINPTRHLPIDYLTLTYLIIHELDFLVQGVILSQGDKPIPKGGLTFIDNGAAIFAKSYLPSRVDLTYGTMAVLLTGIWGITALYGSFEFDMEVYFGSQDEAHYRGHLAVSFTGGTRKAVK